ncbi:MAG: helix-turn-helix transcriptional regulator [Paracoccaceae bacterium]
MQETRCSAAASRGGQAMTGDDFRALRKQRGLSRVTLARLAGVHPDTVRYWERKAIVDLRGWAPDRLLKAMGLDKFSRRHVYPAARFKEGIFPPITRAWGGVLDLTEKYPVTTRSAKTCGARTRKGTPCRTKALPGKTRCKFHGGLSTGARTPEGIERIREAQRRRWARWRADNP